MEETGSRASKMDSWSSGGRFVIYAFLPVTSVICKVRTVLSRMGGSPYN